MKKQWKRILWLGIVLCLAMAAPVTAHAATKGRRTAAAPSVDPGYYLISYMEEDGAVVNLEEVKAFNVDIGLGFYQDGTGVMIIMGEYDPFTYTKTELTATDADGETETISYTYADGVVTLSDDDVLMRFEKTDRPIPSKEEVDASMEALTTMLGVSPETLNPDAAPADNDNDDDDDDDHDGNDDGREEKYVETAVAVGGTYELMEAIREDATIVLLPGEYNLTQWIEANFDRIPEYNRNGDNAPGVYKESCFDGYQVVVCDIDNLTIMSADTEESAQIVCEPRYADVLSFEYCDDLTLDSLVIGHTPDQGSCTGDCVALNSCDDVTINYCDIYGCGAYALTLDTSDNVRVTDTSIHDCSYGVAIVENSDNLKFSRCAFYDCEQFTMFELHFSTVRFLACSFENLNGNLISVDGGSRAHFLLCEMDQSAGQSLQGNDQLGDQITVIEDIPKG